MSKITYVGLKEPSAKVTWCGVTFALNLPVELSRYDARHAEMIEKARANPAFVVDDDMSIEDIEVVATVATEPLDGPPDDYVPDEGADIEAEKRQIRDKLAAYGVKAGGRSGVEYLRQRLEEVEASNAENV